MNRIADPNEQTDLFNVRFQACFSVIFCRVMSCFVNFWLMLDVLGGDGAGGGGAGRPAVELTAVACTAGPASVYV